MTESSATKYLYSITLITSGYKSELTPSRIKTFLVRSTPQDAHDAMVKMATDFYERDPIIQEARDKYFRVYNEEVVFGENQDYGIGYRSAWGMFKLEKVEIHSLNDPPPS